MSHLPLRFWLSLLPFLPAVPEAMSAKKSPTCDMSVRAPCALGSGSHRQADVASLSPRRARISDQWARLACLLGSSFMTSFPAMQGLPHFPALFHFPDLPPAPVSSSRSNSQPSAPPETNRNPNSPACTRRSRFAETVIRAREDVPVTPLAISLILLFIITSISPSKSCASGSISVFQASYSYSSKLWCRSHGHFSYTFSYIFELCFIALILFDMGHSNTSECLDKELVQYMSLDTHECPICFCK